METDNQTNGSEELKEDQGSPSGTGPFVGAIIIILLMGAGAFYFWSSRSGLQNNNPPPLILGNDTDTASSSDTSSEPLPQEASGSEGSININQANSQNDAVLKGFQQSSQ
ncbi:MAG: hypothetical protein NUV88_01625 [Candidatus Kaiserbacteria bacterium]|nr:hypothetical protein [Candidatus Kaiserbacteria bacterium]